MIPKDRAKHLAKQCLPLLLPNDKKETQLLLEGVDGDDVKLRQLCRLWAGMGHIYVATISGGVGVGKNVLSSQFVIKHVKPPSRSRQSFGDRRKADSYQVESNIYENLAESLIEEHGLNLPKPYFVEHGPSDGEITICMSLLQGSCINTMDIDDTKKALTWMAKFHAAYWGKDVIDQAVEDFGLQKVGTYWHLDTRPDEHESMARRGWEGRLKKAARAIDDCLKRDPMQGLVHGDPKEANIMILDGSNEVALYDFQYCGRGSPTRDIAYFLCSSCDETDEDVLVRHYYDQLCTALTNKSPPIQPPTFKHFQDSLELAFCDYCRFMCGWGHWGYDIKGRVKRLLDRIDGGKDLGSEERYDEALRNQFW